MRYAWINHENEYFTKGLVNRVKYKISSRPGFKYTLVTATVYLKRLVALGLGFIIALHK